MNKKDKAKVAEAQERFQTWRRLFDVRGGLSEDLRKAAIAYGDQQRLVVAGGGVDERKGLFTREIALLQLSLEYSTVVNSMERLKQPPPQPRKVKNARRSRH